MKTGFKDHIRTIQEQASPYLWGKPLPMPDRVNNQIKILQGQGHKVAASFQSGHDYAEIEYTHKDTGKVNRMVIKEEVLSEADKSFVDRAQAHINSIKAQGHKIVGIRYTGKAGKHNFKHVTVDYIHKDTGEKNSFEIIDEEDDLNEQAGHKKKKGPTFPDHPNHPGPNWTAPKRFFVPIKHAKNVSYYQVFSDDIKSAVSKAKEKHKQKYPRGGEFEVMLKHIHQNTKPVFNEEDEKKDKPKSKARPRLKDIMPGQIAGEYIDKKKRGDKWKEKEKQKHKKDELDEGRKPGRGPAPTLDDIDLSLRVLKAKKARIKAGMEVQDAVRRMKYIRMAGGNKTSGHIVPIALDLATQPGVHSIGVRLKKEDLDEGRKLYAFYTRKNALKQKSHSIVYDRGGDHYEVMHNTHTWLGGKKTSKELVGKKEYDSFHKKMVARGYTTSKKLNEEPLDEVSKETLRSYVDKADKDRRNLAWMKSTEKMPRLDQLHGRRVKGLASAKKKLEEEKKEQLDEISKRALRKYIHDAEEHIDHYDATMMSWFASRTKEGRKGRPNVAKSHNNLNKFLSVQKQKRVKGIALAKKKLDEVSNEAPDIQRLTLTQEEPVDEARTGEGDYSYGHFVGRTLDKIHKEGEKAAQEGKPHTANPHKEKSYAWMAWTHGWGRHHIKSGKSVKGIVRTLKKHEKALMHSANNLDSFHIANAASHHVGGAFIYDIDSPYEKTQKEAVKEPGPEEKLNSKKALVEKGKKKAKIVKDAFKGLKSKKGKEDDEKQPDKEDDTENKAPQSGQPELKKGPGFVKPGESDEKPDLDPVEGPKTLTGKPKDKIDTEPTQPDGLGNAKMGVRNGSFL